MMSTNLRNITILKIKGPDYCCIISLTSKNDAINLTQNADFTEKHWTFYSKKKLFSYIKMGIEILAVGDMEIEKTFFLRFFFIKKL